MAVSTGPARRLNGLCAHFYRLERRSFVAGEKRRILKQTPGTHHCVCARLEPRALGVAVAKAIAIRNHWYCTAGFLYREANARQVDGLGVALPSRPTVHADV